MQNIILQNLEIAAFDLPDKMQWTDVPAAIEALGGNGWRLPTEDEFATLYHLYKVGIWGFKPERYWSGSTRLNKAWYYDFSKGYSPHVIDTTNLFYVRLVRSR